MGQLGLGNQTDAVPSPAQVPPEFPSATPQPRAFASLFQGWVFWGGRSGISPPYLSCSLPSKSRVSML